MADQGQTTIPASIRKALGLKARQRLSYELVEGGVLIRPEAETLMDLAGSLKSDQPAGSREDERAAARRDAAARYESPER